MAHHSPAQPALHINLRRLNRWLMVLVGFAAVGYFLTVTALSTRGFIFKDLKSQQASLAEERRTLENAMTGLASYQDLQSRIRSSNFVAADTVSYISWNDSAVAKR